MQYKLEEIVTMAGRKFLVHEHVAMAEHALMVRGKWEDESNCNKIVAFEWNNIKEYVLSEL